MHPLTCYAGQINLCHANIEKNFCHDQQGWGRDNFLILWGGHSCYEGGIELMGGPPTGENPATGGDCIFETCEIPMGNIK